MADIEYKTPEDVRDEKMRAKAEKAYTKSLRNTEEAPLSNRPKGISKKFIREAQMNSRQTEMPRVDEMGNAYKKGGMTRMASGGFASKRADGVATKGKTRGKMC
jgi:hypothetical protein